jgi:tetratricopeptide (TPR) repeat protein
MRDARSAFLQHHLEGQEMTDFTPFDQLLAGHAGLLEDTHHDRWVRAQSLFEERAYREAAALLSDLVDDPKAAEFGHALTDVRLLLARALFHSAQLNGALETAEALLVDEPGEAYAHLIAGRSLQRLNRRDEAARHLKLAKVLGGYGS